MLQLRFKEFYGTVLYTMFLCVSQGKMVSTKLLSGEFVVTITLERLVKKGTGCSIAVLIFEYLSRHKDC